VSGDGISLQTTISQLGNVAKTQAKSQQANQPTTPLSEQIDRSKDLKVDRVKETERTAKQRVDPDAKKERKRKRRGRRNLLPEDEAALTAAESEGERPDEEEEESGGDVGRLLDTLA
jgi:hypothetical protein